MVSYRSKITRLLIAKTVRGLACFVHAALTIEKLHKAQLDVYKVRWGWKLKKFKNSQPQPKIYRFLQKKVYLKVYYCCAFTKIHGDAVTRRRVKSTKSNLSLYLLYYAEACNELVGLISASLRQGNTAPFEEMLQWWRAAGNTVTNLTGRRFTVADPKGLDRQIAPYCRFLAAHHTKLTGSIQKLISQ